MSVIVKLSDQDAALVGRVLAAVGTAAIAARNLPASPAQVGALPDAAKDIRAGERARALGNRVSVAVLQSYDTPDELIRLGHFFETARRGNIRSTGDGAIVTGADFSAAIPNGFTKICRKT